MLYIFDLDGTLTDTLSTIAYFANSALVKNGFSAIPTERYKRLVGNGRDVLIHRMLAEYNADTPQSYNAVGADYDFGYEHNMLYLTKPYDGIEEALAALKGHKNTLAVLSNKPTAIVEYVIKELFPENLFSYVSGQREGVPTKPDPSGALYIAKTLDFAPSECMFVGDTNVDISTGKNAGMKTAGVLWGFRDRAELEAAGADIIIESPREIADL